MVDGVLLIGICEGTSGDDEFYCGWKKKFPCERG